MNVRGALKKGGVCSVKPQKSKIVSFIIKKRKGQAFTEYSLIIMLAAIVLVLIMNTLGESIVKLFSAVTEKLFLPG